MDYFDSIFKGLSFALTAPQWRALIFLLLITSGVTETVKRVFLLRASAARKKQVIYSVAFVTGIAAGLLGWWLVGAADVPGYYWLTFGVIVGPLANFLHWATMGVVAWKFPGFAAALKGRK